MRALALKLQPDAAIAVFTGGVAEGRIKVEAVVSIPLTPDDDAATRGRAIATALRDLKPGRLPTILTVPRCDLSVLNLDLPPAPPIDLPDLVHLQAQRDLPLAEDGEGFDFIPLEGDEDHPYKVLGVGLLPNAFKLLRETCEAADLRLERIVPEPLGWPELGRRVVAGDEDSATLRVFSSIIQRQAVAWAVEGERLKLVRTMWLPEDDNAAADAAALGGELRRTLLALAQSHPVQRGGAKCVYVGVNADEIAGELGATLSKPVQAVSLERLISLDLKVDASVPLVEVAPMAALAFAAGERLPAAIDLLHPRQRPAPPSRSRTYVLAGIAAAALTVSLAWTGYRNLQEPLEAAELARVQQNALQPMLESLAADEAKAASVRNWLASSTNLLTELDHLGQHLRPESLASEQFKADSDVVLKKLTVANRQLTLDAAAKNNNAIPAAEARLRAANYRVDRGPVQPGAEGMPGYEVSVSGIVQRVDESAPPAGDAP